MSRHFESFLKRGKSGDAQAVSEYSMNADLERRIVELGRKLHALSHEVEFAVQYLRSDPNASLVRARIALEKLVIAAYRELMSKEPKKRQLGHILNDPQFACKIDRRILSRMQAVRDMGNLGAHGEHVLSEDANRALLDLSDILEWYFNTFGPTDPISTPTTTELSNITSSDTFFVQLGIKICSAIYAELKRSRGNFETEISVSEPKHGQIVSAIDILCNNVARNVIQEESELNRVRITLTGEDLPTNPRQESDSVIICCLDSLDGTQHWLRGRNLFCTAVSFFTKLNEQSQVSWQLRASHICTANGDIYYAREDHKKAYVHGSHTPLRVRGQPVTQLRDAHVCTVARRPAHYEILLRHLINGSPFSGLYTFGGNPILASLAMGEYDAVFQPDASDLGDNQELWDWLPGGHIAQRSGATILTLSGEEFDIAEYAILAITGSKTNFPYVAARSPELAHNIVEWLKSANIY